MDNRAIGVFDSGLGGLTALVELKRLMPSEKIVYFGDSANMPYGEKTPDEIVELSLKNLNFLLSKDVKAVLIACGTATSYALETLQKESPVPVFGVIDASVKTAVSQCKNGRLGLLATRAGIASGAFQKKIREAAPDIILTDVPCPKFAAMVEHGLFERRDPVVREAAEEYLPALKEADVDTVILGCTHYPLLREVISEYIGGNVKLIDAGASAAASLEEYLINHDMCAEKRDAAAEYYTTGDKETFAKTACVMLKKDISQKLYCIPSL